MKGAHSATAFRLIFSATLLVCAAAVHAQSASISAPAQALAARYPAASIKSSTLARSALNDVAAANARAQWAAYDQEVECQKRFFVTSCQRDVQHELRAATAQIKRVEVEANRFLRHADDADREQRHQQALLDAQAEADRIALEHDQDQAAFEQRQQEAAEREANAKTLEEQRAAQAQELDKQRQARIDRAAQPDGLDANPAARAQNVRDYEDKQRAAQERRAELAQRRADRAAKPQATESGAAAP